jgi:hypothetical protein
MKNELVKILLSIVVILMPTLCQSQTTYDNEVLGSWVGEIYGGGLPKKSIKIVITKSNYKAVGGVCLGYSLVNNSNKTSFSGTVIVEADMPIIEAFEPKTNPKNGKFYLLVGCFENDEIISDLTCGTWTSYDGKIKRKIRVKKSR